MYYYPRIPKSFSPSPFGNKMYNNSTIEKIFHPSTTPHPMSPINKRRRSFSVAQKAYQRSTSKTRGFQQNSVQKPFSNSIQNTKLIKYNGKVTVHYINNITTKGNISSNHKTIKINLDDYFEKVYFLKLSGIFNKELNQKLEPYIKEIVLLDEQNSQIQQNWIPLEYQGINTKEKLLSSIKKLQKINRKQFIKELIQYYCIPSQKIRTTVLMGLIADIHLKLRQKTFMEYSFTSYCLMTNRGKLISDIIKLPLSSIQIIFCEKSNYKEHFSRFKQMKSKGEVDDYQNNLLDIIKNSFRDRVKNIDQQFKPYKIKNFQKKIYKQTISIVSKRKKFPIQHKNQKVKRNQKSMNIAKLKQEYQISTKQALKLVDEFYNLIGTNNRYPQAEHYSIQLKLSQVLINNFKQNCVSLQGKQKQNVENILLCIEFPAVQTVDLKKFIEFRLIVECLAEPAKVVRFLMRFLRLDVQKQLTKQMLTQSLRLTLNEYKIPRSNRVIIDILWLQFKRANLIQYVDDEQYLTVNRFKENYLLNKTVYYLIMTIIFRTNDPVQSAYDVLS